MKIFSKLRKNKYKAFISRELESREERKMFIVFFIFAFNLIYIGYFSTYKGLLSYIEKTRLLAAYSSIEQTIESNTLAVYELNEFLLNSNKTTALDNSIASNTRVVNYMESLGEIGTRQGFVLTSFSRSRVSDSTISMDVIFEGRATNVPELVFNLENQARFSSFDKFTVNTRRQDINQATVTTNVKIYHVPKELAPDEIELELLEDLDRPISGWGAND